MIFSLIRDVAKEVRLDWKNVKNIDKRNARKYIVELETVCPTKIGVDEIAYESGHKYLTIVRDIDLGKVIWVGEGRKKETLEKSYTKKEALEKSYTKKEAFRNLR